MPFEAEARRILPTLAAGSANHAILGYLLANAVGEANAKSWEAIEAHCLALPVPVPVDKEEFQQGFLKHSREHEIYIGSSNRGYFIIHDRNDALHMKTFYEDRIAREQARVRHLERLVRAAGWPAI